MLQTSPILRIAHELKEDILKIYNSNITPNRVIKKMKKWLASARIILGNAAETLNMACNQDTCKTVPRNAETVTLKHFQS